MKSSQGAVIQNPSITGSASRRGPAIRPWMVVLALCLLYLAVIGATYRNVLEFVRIGSRYDSADFSSDPNGYDGQFNYYIARDPLNAPALIDVPAYRYQRILYPILARVLAFGQTRLIPYALLAISLAALAAGTALIESLLLAERVNRWYALTYGLFSGVFVAVRYSTNEPLAYGLVIAGIAAAQRGIAADARSSAEPSGTVSNGSRWMILSAGLFALAALTKETTLFFAAGYALYFLTQRRWGAALLISIVPLLPFAAVQVWLHSWLGSWGIGSGGAMATPFEIIPFNGIWRIGADGGLTIFILFAIILIPAAVLPTLWALWHTLRDVVRRRWHPYVFVLLANAAIMPFVPYSTYREPLGIFRFMSGLVISVLLYGALRKARRVLNYSTLWIVFGARVWG